MSSADPLPNKISKATLSALTVSVRLFVIAIVVLVTVTSLARAAGKYLIINKPERADAVVVLAGDQNDRRYYRALELLNNDAGVLAFVDSRSDEVAFGQTLASQEEAFIRRSAGKLLERVRVCPIEGDSTNEETMYVQRCLQGRGLNSIVLVTSDFHTRRALSIFRCRLPQYRWSVAAARDNSKFDEKWWQNREWAKTTVLEWAKLIWWQTVDRWRAILPRQLPSATR